MGHFIAGLRVFGAAAVIAGGLVLVIALSLSSPRNSAAERAAAMLEAAARGDKPAVETALASGVRVDTIEPGSGYTALMHAARLGRVDLEELLLQHGANPDAAAPGLTPLMMAVHWDNPELTELLIARGA